MIKVNELRVGNYIFHTETEEIFSVTGYDISRFGNEKKQDWAKRFIPVTLTPEILEKCGFEKSEMDNGLGLQILGAPNIKGVHVQMDKMIYYSKASIVLHLIKGKWVFIYGKDHLCTGATVTSLHQIQNLYYALTGKELEVKQLKTI